MKIFYGTGAETHFLISPNFLIVYDSFKSKNRDDFYIPEGKEWLLDSSGFQLSLKGWDYMDMPKYDKYWSPEKYAGFINDWKPTYAFTQDYAFYSIIKREWTKKQVKERHEKTNERTAQIREYLDDKSKIANIVQGIVKEDFFNHVQTMIDSGTLTDFLGIGSIMKHPDLMEIIDGIKEMVPSRVKLHGLALKKMHIKQYPALIHKLYSVDTHVWCKIGGIYSAPVKLRSASLYLFIDEMEAFMKKVESGTYLSEFEVEE